MKTVDDFKKAVKERQITRWNIHDCSFCGYPCGFIFSPDGTEVAYDNGCYCIMKEPTMRSWESVADHYNRNAGVPDAEERMRQYPAFAETVKNDNIFWGF